MSVNVKFIIKITIRLVNWTCDFEVGDMSQLIVYTHKIRNHP